jgi:hypothetical protein
MSGPRLPPAFVKLCKSVKAKRPKTVIDHILKLGFITTQELKDTYGYNHPPRTVRDVKEHGIPIEMFRAEGSDGRKIAAYRFGNPKQSRFGRQLGRTAFAKELKAKLVALHGTRCAIYNTAMRPLRRTDIMWTGAEVETYERLKKQTQELQKHIPGYVKEIIKAHLKNTP